MHLGDLSLELSSVVFDIPTDTNIITKGSSEWVFIQMGTVAIRVPIQLERHYVASRFRIIDISILGTSL